MISNTFSSLHKLIDPWEPEISENYAAVIAWHRRVVEVPQGELSLLLHLYDSEVTRHAGLVQHIRGKIGFRLLVVLGLSRWAMKVYFGPVVPIARKDRAGHIYIDKLGYCAVCGLHNTRCQGVKE